MLDTFYQQNLQLFVENSQGLNGEDSVVIREDVLNQLDTAQKIRDIFFSPQNGLGTQFAVETVALSGNKRRSVLNLDGQLVDYAQGRNYTAHLVWPNNMREGNESKLTLVGAGATPRRVVLPLVARGRSSACLAQGSSPACRTVLLLPASAWMAAP